MLLVFTCCQLLCQKQRKHISKVENEPSVRAGNEFRCCTHMQPLFQISCVLLTCFSSVTFTTWMICSAPCLYLNVSRLVVLQLSPSPAKGSTWSASVTMAVGCSVSWTKFTATTLWSWWRVHHQNPRRRRVSIRPKSTSRTSRTEPSSTACRSCDKTFDCTFHCISVCLLICVNKC